MTILEAGTITQAAAIDDAATSNDPLDVRSVLLQSNLPTAVSSAAIAFTRERVIDDAEFRRLTNRPSDLDEDPKYTVRMNARRKVLRRYKGKSLLCAVIHLPGMSYTIEIDPVSKSIAHWEWQED